LDDYTALHRHLGRPRSPVDDELLDAAVEAHLEETDDLDWKKAPQDKDGRKKFIHHAFPEDVAAFANAGGGTLVIGVDEQDSAATERVDAGDWTDDDLRNLHSVAASQLYLPVLGLRTHGSITGTSALSSSWSHRVSTDHISSRRTSSTTRPGCASAREAGG
jgi:hypothetical protein